MEIERTSWELLEIHLYLADALSWTEPLLTGYHSRRLQVLGRTAKLDSATNFCLHRAQHHVPPASKEAVVNLSGKLLDDAVYSAL